MNQTKKIAKVLYIASLVCFYACLAIILSLYLASSFLDSHNKTIGYPLSVNIRSEIADTIISYKKGNKERIHSTNNLSLYHQKTYDVMKDTSYQKALVVQRMAMYDNKNREITTEFSKTLFQDSFSKGEIMIAPKNTVLFTLIVTRHYLVYFLAALIFLQISRFFKILGKDFSFHTNLKTRLKRIAYMLIAYQIIMFLLSIIIMQYLPKAETLTSIPTISGAEITTMTYWPYTEYNLQIIFFGIGLLCIAQLLGYGYNLQKENDLTI